MKKYLSIVLVSVSIFLGLTVTNNNVLAAVVHNASATITPISATTSQSQAYTYTVTNSALSTATIGSINIIVPAEFGTPTINVPIGWKLGSGIINGNSYTNGYSASAGLIGVQANTAGDKLTAGSAVQIEIISDAPAQAGIYEWTTGSSTAANIFGNMTFSGSTFTLTSSQPTVTVSAPPDITAPSITAPINQTFEATGPITSPILIPATATDIVDPSPVITYNPTSFSLGTTTVTWTATDASGNFSTTTSDVIIVDTTAPTITLLGNNPLDLRINTNYADFVPDPDYSANDLVDGDLTGLGNVVITGIDFNDTVLGAHTITYVATDTHGNTATSTRTVNVVDMDRPILYMNGVASSTIEGGTAYTDPGAFAEMRNGVRIDQFGSSTVNIMVVGSYTITYNFEDTDLGTTTGSGIADSIIRTVNVVDTTPPAISINGANPTLLKVGDTYTELGATASDIIDSDRTSSIVTSGSVNTGLAGTYPITYSVADLSGNSTSTVRNVIIRNPGTDASLSDLSVSSGTLAPVFASSTLAYTVTLPYGTTLTPTTFATTSDSFANLVITNATDVTSTTTIAKRTSMISVTAENGTTVNYTIIFNVSTDTTAPVITLLGSNPVNLTVGDTYTDAGATATDNIDGVIATSSIMVNNPVNTSVVGTYTITYSVSDVAGNQALEVTRTVYINARPSGSGSGHRSASNVASSGTDNPSLSSSTESYDATSTDNLIRVIGILAALEKQTPAEEGEILDSDLIQPEVINDEIGTTDTAGDNLTGQSIINGEIATTTGTSTENGIPLTASASASNISLKMISSLAGLIIVGGGIFLFFKILL